MLLKKVSLLIKDNNIRALFLLYLLSNALLLLNINGIYWDDWVIYNQSFDEIKTMANQLTGNTHLFEYIFLFLSQIGNSIFSFRVATFIFYFIAGLFLYFILLDIKALSKKTAFYITLLFLILPVNSARICLCVVHYSVFLCVFFMAFWLLTRYIKQAGGLFARAVILALFYLSFFVNSLLVFYAIVLLYIMYKHYEKAPETSSLGLKISQSIKAVCLYYPDFIILPILFFYIKTHYFVPYGLYENYNAVTWDYFKHHVIANLALSSKLAFYKPLSQALIVSVRFWFLSLIMMGFLFWYLRDRPRENERNAKKNLIMMGLGLFVFMLAIFPYAAIGKLPSLLYFSSRHMLLVPLGLAISLYAGILLIEHKNRTFAHVLLIILLTTCIVKNMHDQAQYLKDWFYQVALEENYKENEALRDNTTFFYRTNITYANNRSMQFYEHNGRLRKIFGDSKRFMGDNINEINTYADHRQYARYNFSEWTFSTPMIVTAQKNTDYDVTQKPFLKLLFCMFTDDVVFRREAKKLLTLEIS